MRTRTKTAILLLAGLAIVVALVAYVGPEKIVTALRAAPPQYLLLAVLAYALFFLLRGVRWKMLFSSSAPDVRLSTTTSTTAVGWLANSILPLKGGDVLRAALLARREGVGLATSAATVGLERVLDLMGLATLAAIGLLILPNAATLPLGIERALAVAWIIPLLAIATLAALVRYRAATVRTSARWLRPLGKLGETITRTGDGVLAGLHALTRQPILLAKLAPITFAISLAQALVFTMLVMAFLRIDPILAFAGSAIFLLSFVVSITPGNVGTYEAAFSAVFIGLGLAPEVALPAAILTHLTTTLTVGLLGGIGLAVLGATPSSLPYTGARTSRGAPR